MTLKVVGAIPTIYQILHFTNYAPVSNLIDSKLISKTQRNPDFAALWAYSGFLRPAFTLANQTLRSDFVKFFTKKTNYNKLFIVASINFFLSPGIILRHYSDSTTRHLKKRTKTWIYSLMALKKITQSPWVVEFSDLFGKKEFLLKKIFTQKIPVSWFFFKVFFTLHSSIKKPRRRIKRWVKKKYFRMTSVAI